MGEKTYGREFHPAIFMWLNTVLYSLTALSYPLTSSHNLEEEDLTGAWG